MKTIWICWLQGEDQAPLLVKRCIASWKEKNPTWRVNIITSENLNEYIGDIIDERYKEVIGKHYAALSDLIRVAFLYKYGGVWADATTYCFKPLDQWLINSAPGGFFCFDNSHEDKTASSWFIYSEKNNPLISSWLFASLEYWLNFDRPPIVHNKKKSPDIYSFLSSQRLSWFDQDLCRRLAIFPYFWFHLLLDEKVLTKEYLRSIYNSKKSINSSSFTRSHMMRQPIKEKDIEMIKGGGMLMFKLTHKFDRKNLDKDTYGYQFENNGKKIN